MKYPPKKTINLCRKKAPRLPWSTSPLLVMPLPPASLVFYSKEARLEYIHRLLIEDYGLTLAWLIIEKTEAGDENDEEIYSRHYTRRAGTARRSNSNSN